MDFSAFWGIWKIIMITNQNGIPQSGFKLPSPVQFDSSSEQTPEWMPAKSSLASASAIKEIQLINLSDGDGTLLFYPRRVDDGLGTKLEVGDVLFLRERTEKAEDEDGVIIQIISLGTASYPHADTKALFRLMVGVRAATINRSHNEPPETIDELLEAQFKVRASISNGKWGQPEGRVVTRNVDIFHLNPAILAQHIFTKINLARLSQDELNKILSTQPGQENDISS